MKTLADSTIGIVISRQGNEEKSLNNEEAKDKNPCAAGAGMEKGMYCRIKKAPVKDEGNLSVFTTE